MDAQQQTPDWEVGKLYRQAYEITKKHKILWLFGIVVGSGLGLNFSNSFGSDFKEFFKDDKKEAIINGAAVLGDSTSKAFEMFLQLFSAIPLWMYLVLGLEILFLIIYLIAFWLIYRAWAEASLLEGVQTSINGQTPTISDNSEKAFRSIKSLIWLNVVPSLVFTLLILIVGGILISIIIVGNTLVKIIFGLLLIPAVLGIITGWIILTMIMLWASRLVVVDHHAAYEAFKKGYKIMKQKFIPTLLLGVFNTVLTWLLYGAVFTVMGIFVLGGFLTINQNTVLSILFFVTGGFLFFLFILLSSVLSGIIATFKASVWSLAYNTIRQTELSSKTAPTQKSSF